MQACRLTAEWSRRPGRSRWRGRKGDHRLRLDVQHPVTGRRRRRQRSKPAGPRLIRMALADIPEASSFQGAVAGPGRAARGSARSGHRAGWSARRADRKAPRGERVMASSESPRVQWASWCLVADPLVSATNLVEECPLTTEWSRRPGRSRWRGRNRDRRLRLDAQHPVTGRRRRRQRSKLAGPRLIRMALGRIRSLATCPAER